jgi:hypothetical protein
VLLTLFPWHVSQAVMTIPAAEHCQNVRLVLTSVCLHPIDAEPHWNYPGDWNYNNIWSFSKYNHSKHMVKLSFNAFLSITSLRKFNADFARDYLLVTYRKLHHHHHHRHPYHLIQALQKINFNFFLWIDKMIFWEYLPQPVQFVHSFLFLLQ